MVYSPLLQEYDPQTLTILQKKFLKIPFEETTERISFIKSKIRIPFGNAEPKDEPFQEEEEKQTDVKEEERYKSQLDQLYLIWKALDFEQIFEAVNNEKQDLMF